MARKQNTIKDPRKLRRAIEAEEANEAQELRDAEFEAVKQPLISAYCAEVARHTKDLPDALTVATEFAEKYETATLETMHLRRMKSTKTIIREQRDQIDPKTAKMRAERSAVGDRLRAGHWIGGTKVLALPPNHPMAKLLETIDQQILFAERKGQAVVDLAIDDQASVCERNGWTQLINEVDRYRKEHRETQKG